MIRRDRPQPVAADLSEAAVLFPSPWGEGQGEGKGDVETLAWDHPISIASGVPRLNLHSKQAFEGVAEDERDDQEQDQPVDVFAED